VSELEHAILVHQPDVITLDLLMPGKAGLSVIRRLAERVSVVVVSDAKRDSPLARESLAQGACAFVPKREVGQASGRVGLLSAIARSGSLREMRASAIVAIAGSTGAMPALEAFAGQLGQLDAAVALVQHLPAERMSAFTDWISSLGLRAEMVTGPRALARGRCLVAPGTHHLTVTRGERAQLDDSPALAGHRPSATVLYRSLIPYGSRVVAVVLSGMGRDGAEGLEGLVAAGARCIVQRPDTCPVPGMPSAAIEVSRGTAWLLAPHEIGLAVRGWLSGRHA
jgi:two-component system, chemotaxis family, protein-glutamate methylesterase/glutaminase